MRDRTKRIFENLAAHTVFTNNSCDDLEEAFEDSESEYFPSDTDDESDDEPSPKKHKSNSNNNSIDQAETINPGPSGIQRATYSRTQYEDKSDTSDSDYNRPLSLLRAPNLQFQAKQSLIVNSQQHLDEDEKTNETLEDENECDDDKENRRISEHDLPDIGQEVEQESIVARKKNSRKRKSDPKTWKRCEMRDKREKGEAYKNYKGIEIAQKLPCTGKRLCGIKCRLKCDIMFTDEARIRLFEEYYSLNYEQKNAYLFGVMEPFLVKQPSGRNRHRAKSFKYAFTVSGQRQQVCKEAVMSMLAVGRKKLDFIRNQISNGRLAPKKDDRGLHANRPHATPDEKIRFVHEHIKSFPSEMSHYSRHKNPNRLYLSPWLSINKMYDLYKEKCAIENVSPVSNGKYRNIFVNDFNFGFGSPKTDTCKICDVEKNDEHIKKFKRAFEQQKIDRGIGKNNEKTIYLTFDLQKTLPLPKISTGKAFYLRQVWLYNLGIHVITTQHPSGKGFFNVWTENEGGRGPEEVGSSLLVFLENIKEQDRTFDHLIAWSDSAAGQNKNFYIVCLWHYLINLGVFKKIEHKFPEVGHTFMDSDRDFAAVEKCIRKQQNIYTVDQYLQIMTEARKKTPFNITRIADKFVDIKELPRKLGLIDRKKSEKNEKFTFREVRWIQIEEFGITKYRYSFDEQEEWTIVDIRKNRMMERTQGNRNLVLETVDKSRAIAAKKYDNIQEQLPFIPENLRGFYNNLRRAED